MQFANVNTDSHLIPKKYLCFIAFFQCECTKKRKHMVHNIDMICNLELSFSYSGPVYLI